MTQQFNSAPGAQVFVATVVFDVSNTTSHYGSPKQYDFNCDIIVQQGNTVVVNTATGLQLARVVGVKSESNQVKDHAWVIQVVDLSRQQARIEAKKRADAAKRKLDKLLKEQSELDKYEVLAAKNPEAAKLLTELKLAKQGLVWEGNANFLGK